MSRRPRSEFIGSVAAPGSAAVADTGWGQTKGREKVTATYEPDTERMLRALMIVLDLKPSLIETSDSIDTTCLSTDLLI
jgi:hypothetical protein